MEDKQTHFKQNEIINNRYRFEKLLGEGGYGFVVKALDLQSNKHVALKFLYAQSDETTLKRFENEAKLTKILDHPNIVKTYDYGTHDVKPYIAMEYVEGISLGTRVNDQLKMPLSFGEIVQILYKVALAMSYAHNKNILHRDIKPENVMLTLDKQVKLADFGLSKLIDDEELQSTDKNKPININITQEGVGLGIMSYMPPEATREKWEKRSDIYSFGIMAYELSTEKKPFEHEDAYQLSKLHKNKPIPELVRHARNFPSWFHDFIKVATEKDPSNRFQSFDEVLTFLVSQAPELEKNYNDWSFLQAIKISLKLKSVRNKLIKRISRVFINSFMLIALLYTTTFLFRNYGTFRYTVAIYALKFGMYSNTIELICNVKINNSTESIFYYADNSDIQNFKILLEIGTDFNITDKNGLPLISHLITKNNSTVIYLLIENTKIDYNVTNKKGETPVMYAAQHLKNDDVLKEIIKKSPVDLRDEKQQTALFMLSSIATSQ